MAKKKFIIKTQANLPTDISLEFTFDVDALLKACTNEDAQYIGTLDHLAEVVQADNRLLSVTRHMRQPDISASVLWSFLHDGESEEINRALGKQLVAFVREHDANALPAFKDGDDDGSDESADDDL